MSGLASILQAPGLTNEQEELIEHFLFVSGYGRSDVLSMNFQSRMFMTRNGGKYSVDNDGSLHRLAGPTWDPEERIQDV